MCTYLWHFHKDEYSWHFWLPSERFSAQWVEKHTAGSASIKGASTDFSFVTVNNTMPVVRPFIHW